MILDDVYNNVLAETGDPVKRISPHNVHEQYCYLSNKQMGKYSNTVANDVIDNLYQQQNTEVKNDIKFVKEDLKQIVKAGSLPQSLIMLKADRVIKNKVNFQNQQKMREWREIVDSKIKQK